MKLYKITVTNKQISRTYYIDTDVGVLTHSYKQKRYVPIECAKGIWVRNSPYIVWYKITDKQEEEVGKLSLFIKKLMHTYLRKGIDYEYCSSCCVDKVFLKNTEVTIGENDDTTK